MPFDRFYCENLRDSTASLEGAELHHLAHVMRVRVGDEVELVDGRGALALAKLTSLDKKRAELEIETLSREKSSPPQILLAIPYLRPSKLEWIVEKGTELGADTFCFYPADLGEKQNLSPHQFERLRTLSISAMKQSGRLFLPHLELMSRFSELFAKEATALYGDPRSGAQKFQTPRFPALFISGPESGFSDEEYAALQKNGVGVSLNPHTLRAETAPIAAAALLAWASGLSSC
ncbi:MAG: 16S rRNA (uracil(1498)-N(3))-methyltransferase [Verrucomicrobia bacterium]|nr:16S rRNA (uracil(1498)-N(3))-methyltransferase [Verrucomicrobiota bacterium]